MRIKFKRKSGYASAGQDQDRKPQVANRREARPDTGLSRQSPASQGKLQGGLDVERVRIR